MKYCLLFLFVFINKSCLSQIVSESVKNDGAYKSSIEAHHKISVENKENSLKLTDLNIDVLLLIFHQLDLNDLLNLSEVDSGIHSITIEVFRRRFQKYEIDIWGTGPRIDWRPAYYVSDHFKSIQIDDFETNLRTIKFFGCVIQKIIIINTKIEWNRLVVIREFIEKYASKSLISLELHKIDILEQITVSFEKLEELDFIVFTEKLSTKVLPLNQTFPNLRRLSVTLLSKIDSSFIDCEFPQLKQLKLFTTNSSWTQQNQIEGLIRKNPQICDIEIKYFTRNYLKIINQLLPNLEKLTLHDSFSEIENIRFEHVKIFIFYPQFSSSIDKLLLPKIESIKLYYAPSDFNIWIKFFKNHRNLSRLHLIEFSNEMEVQFKELTTELPNLVEMTLESFKYVDLETITEFIESHGKLMKCTFSTKMFKVADLDTLRKRFEDKWNIEHSSKIRYDIIFSRKKSNFEISEEIILLK